MKIRNKQIPIRQLLCIGIGWIHCALIFSPLYAMLLNFIVGDVPREEVILNHLRGLLIIVPVISSWFARRYLKNILLYLLATIAAVLLTVWMFDQPVMAAPAILICFLRFYNRLVGDESSLLDYPVYPAMVLLLIPGAAAFFVERLDSIYETLSLLYIAVYFLICFAHHGIQRIDRYVEVNQNMRNMPSRRIVRISSVLLAGIFLFLAVVMLPLLLTNDMDYRYTPPETHSTQMDFAGTGSTTDGPQGEQVDLLAPFQHIEPHPIVKFLVKLMEYLLGIGCGIAMVVGIVYGAIRLSRMFQTSFQDRGDLVENLQDDTLEVIRETKKKQDKLGFFDRSPNALIRRRYKKTILRASKNRPDKWMSPAEAEAHANLTGSTIDRLHVLYEKARYSPDGCTKQDAAEL